MPFDRRDTLERGPDRVLGELVALSFVLGVALLVVLALASPEALATILAAGVSLPRSAGGFASLTSPAGWCSISPAGMSTRLGSGSAAGAGSFAGSESNVSIGSSAAVATPSGFISPSNDGVPSPQGKTG